MNKIKLELKKLGLTDGVEINTSPEILESLYSLWCSKHDLEERKKSSDSAFQKQFGQEAMFVILFLQYQSLVASTLVEYFDQLLEFDASHALPALIACTDSTSFANKSLKKRTLSHFTLVEKAFKKYASENRWNEEWSELESEALELIDDFNDEISAITKRVLDISKEDEEQDDAKWAAMALSMVTNKKKAVPASMESLLRVFGDFFDKNGEYPTVAELARMTSMKKQVIEDLYDELEETFVSQRMD